MTNLIHTKINSRGLMAELADADLGHECFVGDYEMLDDDIFMAPIVDRNIPVNNSFLLKGHLHNDLQQIGMTAEYTVSQKLVQVFASFPDKWGFTVHSTPRYDWYKGCFPLSHDFETADQFLKWFRLFNFETKTVNVPNLKEPKKNPPSYELTYISQIG